MNKRTIAKRVSAIVMALFMTVTLVPGRSAMAASRLSTVHMRVLYQQSSARSLAGKINSFRTGKDAWYISRNNKSKVRVRKLGRLRYDYELERVAMQRAAEIAVKLSHTRPDGTQWHTILDTAKVRGQYFGENIACGQDSVNEAHEAFLETDKKYSGQGHRRQMLNNRYSGVGVACIQVGDTRFWVEEFGTYNPDIRATKALNGKKTIGIVLRKARIKKKKGRYYINSEGQKWSEKKGIYERAKITVKVVKK